METFEYTKAPLTPAAPFKLPPSPTPRNKARRFASLPEEPRCSI